jgi:lysyl-tRNA synthetase class 2
MLFCDQPAIRDVLLFPHLRPEKREQPAVVVAEPAAAEAQDQAAVAESAAAVATAEAQGQAATEPASAEAAPVAADDAEHSAGVPAAQGAGAPVAAGSADGKLDPGISREAAFELLKKYNKDEFHIKHGETLEGLMRYYAQTYDPQNVDFWGIVGLLHDLDWEEWPDSAVHTVKTAELLDEAGANPALARAIQTHNSDNNAELPKPEHKMERVLWACDELSGLIQAAILMKPSKSVMDFNVKSLRKKYKDKRFAAGCDRAQIAKGAELNGMELGDLFASVIEAMKAIAPDRDTFGK